MFPSELSPEKKTKNVLIYRTAQITLKNYFDVMYQTGHPVIVRPRTRFFIVRVLDIIDYGGTMTLVCHTFSILIHFCH